MIDHLIIYDKQDITHLGIEALITQKWPAVVVSSVSNTGELVQLLMKQPASVILLDYSLSDFNSVDTLLNMSIRFEKAHWILFSEEFHVQFIKKIVLGTSPFSVILKSSILHDIEKALFAGLQNQDTFFCAQVADMLLENNEVANKEVLTATEQEILKEMALGKTAKEIASERFISVHTITTHRKNIYRKLQVNNVQEASRYALRAGIVDTSDYYI